ncbi:hypothetical protein [Paraburkholderia aromaticivorans]
MKTKTRLDYLVGKLFELPVGVRLNVVLVPLLLACLAIDSLFF